MQTTPEWPNLPSPPVAEAVGPWPCAVQLVAVTFDEPGSVRRFDGEVLVLDPH